ncbi:MAG TPA: trypsin-like peptidase domain-containing protein [Solirubrobacteraceae bacterium]|jgi:S1-C subfamily serine protease|nr:trypsin-like peptidase domain-containing protein [Solirubrobacteraceae bacterium]
MTRLTKALPVIAGAIAGAIVALLIAHGGATKTVTDEIVSQGTGSVPASTTASGGLSVNQIYKKDSPGVVDITTTSVQQGSGNGFFSQPSQTSESEGAGVVFDKQGDIITDEHVVAGAQTVRVHFQDGVSVPAKILGTDPSTDMAVIKVSVNASELHPIPSANSNNAQVGDPVVAIGSPFGLPGTTTAGIVSAVGRSITAPNNYTIPGAIQTDAAINPGNSGGPLLDGDGDWLGLNDQIQTNSGDSSGVGFATPSDADVQVADTIISGKKVEHPYVGVCLNDASSGGAVIASASNGCTTGPVVAGSPAAKAGLKPGDTITKINGRTITDSDGFISVISTYKPGQTVTLTVHMPGANGATKTIKVTLGNRPASAPTTG